MMNNRKTTMKHDEKEGKKQWNMMKNGENNNEKWWKREKQQWKMMNKIGKQWTMMKNRETTMKNDEK